MVKSKREVIADFEKADAEWTRHLRLSFAADSRNARYEKRGRGTEGSDLRKAYDAREAARQTYAAVVGGNV